MFTRHERSLVIDGETITLLPADHRTEPTKTLTFHISNVICKRNQKSPRKIRLLITRRGNTGEKSVDLETQTDEDATDICNIIVRLRDVYAATGV
ncbi:Component of a membrane-bound complex containing the Tor2p kinase [Coemansia spiralis]|nr:Component of a membrane-bound complex containing the Tor2p kinase [Coemansia spiralis]